MAMNQRHTWGIREFESAGDADGTVAAAYPAAHSLG